MAQIIESSMQDDWLSNAYVVGDEPGGTAVVIDSGGPSGAAARGDRAATT